jgi:biotin synthase-related radical SAM superfamily protein
MWLDGLGVNEVSVNIEVWSDEVARRVMPRKYKQGRDHYLDYLSAAASVMGGRRVRSMFMLGLEPLESTLEGVTEVASRGCTPVLSPFRPDPLTPLRDWPVPSAGLMLEAYLAAREITEKHKVPLGPACLPCAHNTLTLPANHGNGDASISYGAPHAV